MKRFLSLALTTVGLALLSGGAARANYAFEGGQATVRPGVTTGLNYFYNCRNAAYYGISGVAEHGKVTTQETHAAFCGQRNFPATRIFYTPDPGFVGVDNVNLYVGRVVYTVKITVRSEAATAATARAHTPRSSGTTGEAGGRPRYP